MYIRTKIECGFCHRFNNDEQINELVDVMKKNPDAEFHFELSHLGRPSDFFDFSIHDVDDGDTGYYNYIAFSINGKEMRTWGIYEDVPWSAIWSILYSALVVLNPV